MSLHPLSTAHLLGSVFTDTSMSTLGLSDLLQMSLFCILDKISPLANAIPSTCSLIPDPPVLRNVIPLASPLSYRSSTGFFLKDHLVSIVTLQMCLNRKLLLDVTKAFSIDTTAQHWSSLTCACRLPPALCSFISGQCGSPLPTAPKVPSPCLQRSSMSPSPKVQTVISSFFSLSEYFTQRLTLPGSSPLTTI